MFNFDWTINLGQIGIAATFVFSAGAWATGQRLALRSLREHLRVVELANGVSLGKIEVMVETRFAKIETRLEDQTRILIAIARQEERQDAADQRMQSFDQRLAAMNDEIGQVRQFQHLPRVLDGRNA